MAKQRRARQYDNNRNSQVIDFNDAREEALKYKRSKHVHIIPKNTAQEAYVDLLTDPEVRITFAHGPAGTGKTMLAVLQAIKSFKSGEVSRIVVTRPAVSVDEQHGFLPGDLNKKMAPWLTPIFDIFHEYWSPREVNNMVEEGLIEIAPLAFMRGRTFKYCYIIADEIQLTTENQMKMLLTRIGEGSYMSLTGDLEQSDRGEKNGLKDIIKKLENINSKRIGIAKFELKHIERDPVVEEILNLYDKKS